jgi:hypothetical protein
MWREIVGSSSVVIVPNSRSPFLGAKDRRVEAVNPARMGSRPTQ